MDFLTVNILNQINKDYYKKVSKVWNQSRDYSWAGWDNLSQIIQVQSENKEVYKVLDVGCGNARFADFLSKTIPFEKLDYTGLDFDEFLLGQAELRKDLNLLNFKLHYLDLLAWENLRRIESKYDLIVLFGVFHHLPSSSLRQTIMKILADKLNHGGHIIFTIWDFWNNERLRKRVVDLESKEGKAFLLSWNLKPEDLESGDHILNWVKRASAHRFAHHFSDKEISELVDCAELEVVDSFSSDGRSMRRNKYFITRKQG